MQTRRLFLKEAVLDNWRAGVSLYRRDGLLYLSGDSLFDLYEDKPWMACLSLDIAYLRLGWAPERRFLDEEGGAVSYVAGPKWDLAVF